MYHVSCMKRFFIITVFFILASLVYLNRAYAHFFHLIGQRNLPNSTPQAVTYIRPSGSAKPLLAYAALGDSLTAGVGVVRSTDSFPYQVGAALAERKNAPIQVINAGTPGATAADVLKSQIPFVTTYQPQIVTLLIGTNDMHNRTPIALFEKNISSILDALPRDARVLVLTIPYLGHRSSVWLPYRWYFDAQTRRYNRALARAIEGRTVTMIDLYEQTRRPTTTDREYYSADLFHPSPAGYRQWLNAFYAHLDI